MGALTIRWQRWRKWLKMKVSFFDPKPNSAESSVRRGSQSTRQNSRAEHLRPIFDGIKTNQQWSVCISQLSIAVLLLAETASPIF